MTHVLGMDDDSQTYLLDNANALPDPLSKAEGLLVADSSAPAILGETFLRPKLQLLVRLHWEDEFTLSHLMISVVAMGVIDDIRVQIVQE